MSIREYFKNRAIRKYLSVLAPQLKNRYGGGKLYSYGQVTTTAEELCLNRKYSLIGLAVFCDEESLKEYGDIYGETKKFIGYRDIVFVGDGGYFISAKRGQIYFSG